MSTSRRGTPYEDFNRHITAIGDAAIDLRTIQAKEPGSIGERAGLAQRGDHRLTLASPKAAKPPGRAACVMVFRRFVAALGKLVMLRNESEVTLSFEAWKRTGAISGLDLAEATGPP